MQIPSTWRRTGFAALLSSAALGFVTASAPTPVAEIDYRREIWPIIQAKCLECHQPKKRQGSLDMSTRASMLKGGDSGAAFVPGKVEKSLMLELIEFGEMPPRKDKKPAVTQEEFQKLKRWVAAGAPVADEPSPTVPVPPAEPASSALPESDSQ